MMKPFFLRRMLPLALCACLAVTFVTGISPAKSAHAATASPSFACPGTLSWGFGKFWNPGQQNEVHTCAGTLIRLTYQNDANFVLYIAGVARWASNTSSGFFTPKTPVQTIFQSDGNLVVYNFNSLTQDTFANWASNTRGKGFRLSLQVDGNLVIYNTANAAVWASHTCCWR